MYDPCSQKSCYRAIFCNNLKIKDFGVLRVGVEHNNIIKFFLIDVEFLLSLLYKPAIMLYNQAVKFNTYAQFMSDFCILFLPILGKGNKIRILVHFTILLSY